MLTGIGLGLRSQHYDFLEADPPLQIEWFEILTDNYIYTQSRPRQILERIAAKYPIALHGVSMSVGSVSGPERQYLKRLKTLADEFHPQIISDHLCFSGNKQRFSHDLLPLNFSEANLQITADNVKKIQDFLGRPIALENVSSYLTYRGAMPEWEFIAQLTELADCNILLDVNNVYVNARNFRFDPLVYFDAIPKARVVQYHMAGHTNMGSWLFDTHSAAVIQPVWKLYAEAVRRFGDKPMLLEWDAEVPSFRRAEAEALKAKKWIAAAAAKLDPQGSLPFNPTRTAQKARISPALRAASLRQQTQFIAGLTEQPKAEFLAKIIPSGDNTPKQAVQIYADQYEVRLFGHLQYAYPTVEKAVGKKLFHQAALKFIATRKCAADNLAEWRKGFSTVLAPYRKSIPLKDMCVIEDALSELVQHAPPRVEPAKAILPKQKLRFPATVVLRSVATQSIKHFGKRVPSASPAKATLMFTRTPAKAEFHLLTNWQAVLLKQLMLGRSIERAIAGISRFAPAPIDVSQFFALLARAGVTVV